MNINRDYTVIAEDVKRAQDGDRAAMDRIIEDVQDSVYYTCLGVLHDADAAQDATQDVLCTVFTKLNTLRNPGAYIGWVNRITANTCKLVMTRSGRELFLKEDEDGNDPFAFFEQTDEQAVPDKAIDNAETQRMIVELVNKLPDEQRMCVLLYYYDQMKTREIADALNVSAGTIKSRLNYARKSIKEGVQEYEKQGIKLYGISPIPFIGYFLRMLAKSKKCPITPAIVRAAATAESAATAASGMASATAAAAASAEFITEGARLAGGVSIGAMLFRIGVGIAAVALFVGIGYGVYRWIDLPKRRNPAPVPTASPVADAEATDKPEETILPDVTATPAPTPDAEPTPEPEESFNPTPTASAVTETPKPNATATPAAQTTSAATVRPNTTSTPAAGTTESPAAPTATPSAEPSFTPEPTPESTPQAVEKDWGPETPPPGAFDVEIRVWKRYRYTGHLDVRYNGDGWPDDTLNEFDQFQDDHGFSSYKITKYGEMKEAESESTWGGAGQPVFDTEAQAQNYVAQNNSNWFHYWYTQNTEGKYVIHCTWVFAYSSADFFTGYSDWVTDPDDGFTAPDSGDAEKKPEIESKIEYKYKYYE